MEFKDKKVAKYVAKVYNNQKIGNLENNLDLLKQNRRKKKKFLHRRYIKSKISSQIQMGKSHRKDKLRYEDEKRKNEKRTCIG